MLYRDHVTAIQRGQKPNAGIDRLVAQHASDQSTNQNRASAAIALGTAFLGSGQPPLDPQEIQQGVAGPDIVQPLLRPVQQKPNVVARFHSTLA